MLPGPGAPPPAEPALDALEQPGGRLGVGLEAQQVHETPHVLYGTDGAGDRLAGILEGRRRAGVDRQVVAGELAELLAFGDVHVDAALRQAVDLTRDEAVGRRGAVLEALCQQRLDRGAPVGRQVDAIERHHQQFRRGHLQVEQQRERVGQLQIGEVPQQRAVDAAFEQARQDGVAQQVLPPSGFEVEHGACELRHERLRERRLGRSQERGHLFELRFERVSRIVARRFARERHQHAGNRVGVGHELGELRDRQGLRRRHPWIHAHPPLVGRVQVGGARRGRHGRAGEQVAEAGGLPCSRGADVEHRRTHEHRDLDARDPERGQTIGQRLGRLPAGGLVVRGNLAAEAAQLPERRVTKERDRPDSSLVQAPGELGHAGRP